jgi:hypothetical protein
MGMSAVLNTINGTIVKEQWEDCKLTTTTKFLTPLGHLVLTFNWLTFVAFLCSEYLYFRREAWLLSHFDDNDAAPYNKLPTFIGKPAFVDLLAKLRAKNRMAKTTAFSMAGLCSLNLFLSCLLLLRGRQEGGRLVGIKTLVSLASNVLLLARRVVLNVRISNLCAQEDLALSMYQLKFRSFNDLHKSKKLLYGDTAADSEAERQSPSEGVPVVPAALMSPRGGALDAVAAQLERSFEHAAATAAVTGPSRVSEEGRERLPPLPPGRGSPGGDRPQPHEAPHALQPRAPSPQHTRGGSLIAQAAKGDAQAKGD